MPDDSDTFFHLENGISAKSLFRNILQISHLNSKIWREFLSNSMIPKGWEFKKNSADSSSAARGRIPAMLYKHISARPVEQLDAALNRGIYELVGADEQDVCRPRTASKQLSSVATESLANECNRDTSPIIGPSA